MSCLCDSKPRIFYSDDADQVFLKRLKKQPGGPWVSVLRCKYCGTVWKQDEQSDRSERTLLRIPKEESWESFDDTRLRKELLLNARGGLAAGKCIWKGCYQRCVKGSAFCLDHLFDTGARR